MGKLCLVGQLGEGSVQYEFYVKLIFLLIQRYYFIVFGVVGIIFVECDMF